jgi:uroporphyrinogen decarboxylase
VNHKERVLRAMAGKLVDRLPIQIDFTGGYARRVARHWGVEVGELNAHLGNDLVYTYSLALPDFYRLDEGIRQRALEAGLVEIDEDAGIIYDDWGVGQDFRSEGFWLHVHPLEDADKIQSYPFPDPTRPELMAVAEEMVRDFGHEYAVVAGQSSGVFERCWRLRGYENFMVDLASNPSLAEYLMDVVTEYQMELARRFVEVGVSCALVADDYGLQHGLQISPAMWRRYIKPRLARIYQVYRESGVVVMQHSCGDVSAVVGDMVEIGLQVLQPVQPKAMSIHVLAEQFGEGLGFFGGIDTQQLLPFGTPDEVDAAVREAIEVLGRHGRYIVSPSQEIMSDVPIANVEALVAAARKYGVRSTLAAEPEALKSAADTQPESARLQS